MRRRTLLVALAGLAVVVAVGVAGLWPRADRVTRANYDRIQFGMTPAEVEAILGPPGDCRTGLGETGYGEGENGSTVNMVWRPDPATAWPPLPNWTRVPGQSPDLGRWASWMNDSFVIAAAIDDRSGCVNEKFGYPRRTTQRGIEKIFWRLKRPWHRWFP
jgi:hypothetical protein